MIIIPMKWSA